MLPRRNRLTKSADITAVLKSGRRVGLPHVRLYARTNTTLPVSRAAVIVSKKVSPSAVVRHRYQRWLREHAGQLIPQLTSSTDLVYVAQSSLAQIPTAQAFHQTVSTHTPKLLDALNRQG